MKTVDGLVGKQYQLQIDDLIFDLYNTINR